MYIEIYLTNGESIRLDDDAKIEGIFIHDLTSKQIQTLFAQNCIELTKYDLTYFVNTVQIAYFQKGEGIR
ncbi:lmo0673 family protein [Listeria ilorinensis]|uniref:lmo0673 family protein n=1 Tax=Listeria ilorinensis TaxID=2867439 RepID=UPI001EF5D4AD|nr:hypothetical protein [Listeria ilorinensis]